MPIFNGPWLPGSFTKNFSWGKGQGLRRLHESINVGFNGELKPVLRDEYRARVANLGRPDFIPLNFFLFNSVKEGKSYLAVDELIFQALTAPHSERFDKLALFAFNLSMVGSWKGAQAGQRYPALWARAYIADRLAEELQWDTANVSATDIEKYLSGSGKFQAETTRKVATNLNYLYKTGGLEGLASIRINRWWVDALFLAIDRLIADRELDGDNTSASELPSLLLQSKFAELAGPKTTEKSFAMAHLLSLYQICGGKRRFDPDSVKDRISVIIPDYVAAAPNDPRPQGALHPTNPRILKTIPRECAPLAQAVGFQIIWASDLEAFNPEDFVRDRATQAITNLSQQGVVPRLTAEQLHKLTRGE
ncbi:MULTISPECIES: hypothetical protein [unclassified Novosphingobium]|uniref:hypothetical protein n=1 Tax=unclassified Novosphingobium TaxID=2644732 RepID=UPI00135C16AA|nr:MULTISPECIES: hypothetical protein [unclassified Novosphingobium]